MTNYEYTLHVSGDPTAGYTARIDDDPAGPLRGWGETPILALAALNEVLLGWARGGADAWLQSPAGRKLATMFGVDMGRGGGPQQS